MGQGRITLDPEWVRCALDLPPDVVVLGSSHSEDGVVTVEIAHPCLPSKRRVMNPQFLVGEGGKVICVAEGSVGKYGSSA